MNHAFQMPTSYYLLLLAIETGSTIDVTQTGSLTLRIPGLTAPQLISDIQEALNELEEDRKFITIEESGPVVTERGRYWLDRWMTQRFEKGKI